MLVWGVQNSPAWLDDKPAAATTSCSSKINGVSHFGATAAATGWLTGYSSVWICIIKTNVVDLILYYSRFTVGIARLVNVISSQYIERRCSTQCVYVFHKKINIRDFYENIGGISTWICVLLEKESILDVLALICLTSLQLCAGCGRLFHQCPSEMWRQKYCTCRSVTVCTCVSQTLQTPFIPKQLIKNIQWLGRN